MPDSSDRFRNRAIRQAIAEQQAYIQRLRAQAEEERVEMPQIPEWIARDDTWVTLGTLRDNGEYTFTFNNTFSNSQANWSVVATQQPLPAAADPTDWYGPCGARRCNCTHGGGVYYRDAAYRQVIPGTAEARGYRLETLKPGGRYVARYWQANSERRARAYQGHFFPEDKIVHVRRTWPRRRRTAAETYRPEQVNVMLPGVEFEIDDTRIY